MIYDRENFIIPNHISPDPSAIKKAARALLEAKAPVMWVGDQISKDNACGEVLELAELLSIPVCDYPWPTVYSSYANFSHKHPLYGGLYNGKDKDLVLNFGFNHNMGAGRFGMKEETPIIYCSTHADSIARVHPFAIAMVANSKLALRGLIDTIKSMATESRIKQIAASRKGQEPNFRSKVARIKSENIGQSPIHPDELAFIMDGELDKNCILVHEYQQNSPEFFSVGPGENEKKWVSNKGLCLGWGIGAAIGAKIAAPDRQVVLNIGEGSVMYSASGFWTMARYEIPILTVVSNNHCYESIRKAYTAYNGRMKAANRFTGAILDNPLIDFVGLAKSQGCDGIRVERSADLRPALKRGIEATRAGTPFLIDVEVARTGPGADSTWFQKYSVAQTRKKKV